MARYGVFLPVVRRLPQTLSLVRTAEHHGCDSIWLPQQEYARDALLMLAAYGAATSRIGLGTAVLPIYPIHPAAMVQAAATLDELCGGRLRLGLGVGHASIVRRAWGLEPGPPLAAMREYVAILRAGFAEGTVDHRGPRFDVHWSYAGARRPQLPILLAALRPKMLELAGEVADGAVLWLATAEYLREVALPAIRRGRERRGKSLDGFEIAVIVNVCATADLDSGRDLTARILAPALGFGSYRTLLVSQGLHPGANNIEPGLLDRLAAVGDPQLIRERLAALRSAGCTLPLLAPCPNHPGGIGFEETLAAVSA